jgi:UDP:flavonoid glycosyltransferase YjiC (YdhE family)
VTQPIVFVPHTWGLSHVGRSLLVAQELQRRGVPVLFAGDGPLVGPEDSLVRRAGVAVVEMADVPMHEVLVNGFGFHNRESLRKMVAAELAMIRRIRPRLIVSDYRPSVHVSAAIERVPVVSFLNACYSHFWGDRLTPPLEHPVTVRFTRLLGRRLGMALLKQVAPRIAAGIFRKDVAVYNDLLAEHGLPPHADILRLFEGSHGTVLVDGPPWVRVKHALPSKVCTLANPLYWSAPEEPCWDSGIPQDLPWIYLSGGSSANPEIFPSLWREIAGMPYRFVMSTAGLPLPPGMPDNITARDFLPAEAVMRRSRLAIINGGPSVYQACTTRTPMLVVAMRGDQEWNSRDLERFGVGRAIHCRHVIDRPGFLRGTIEAMVADPSRYRPGLDALADRMAAQPAVEQVAAWLGETYETLGPVTREVEPA